MRLDKTGKEFIYEHEGVRLKAYKDAVGIPTIGVGFTFYPGGKKVEMGDTISQTQCDAMFTVIVSSFEDAVNKFVKVPINQNQFNALVSFSFNVGIGALEKSTLLKYVNANASAQAIQAAFEMWDKGSGHVIADLLQRRKEEADLYNKTSNEADSNAK